MRDPLTWSPICLGRWFGTTIRLHIVLILFVGIRLLLALFALAGRGTPSQFLQTACWLGLLLVALAIHELGHAVTAAWLDCDQEDVHVWPLGSLVGPNFVPRSSEHIVVALAGPVTSGAACLFTALGVNILTRATFDWSPFGRIEDAGAPILATGSLAAPLSVIWIAGWFRYLNWVIFLANLIPALPFDFGRMFRAYLGSTSVVSSRDNMFAPWTARACALFLVLGGIVRLVVRFRVDGMTLIALGLLVELMVRSEARLLEDGGYFDDGVFGYDFSDGYTSLEGSAAKVRPHRESAIKRWRRRRSEQRRQRRLAREAAEERRMDEILEKLHRDGRGALTDEENRFLIRVSMRLRNRTKHA
jgi:stage IV sporulation protein FB